MFYYLNKAQTPCGPHREEELFTMLRKGKLAPDTLVAEDGGDAWYTLAQKYEQHRYTTPCPNCNNNVVPEAGTKPLLLPLYCPHCGDQLRPVCPQNFFSNIAFTLRHAFRFSGRATRREFWSAVLGSILAIPVAMGIILSILDFYIDEGVQVINCILAVVFCAGISFCVGMTALCTRRLRDGGMNIKLMWGLLGYPLYIILMFVSANPYFNVRESFYFLQSIATFLFFLSFVFTMIIAVLALAESKHPS